MIDRSSDARCEIMSYSARKLVRDAFVGVASLAVILFGELNDGEMAQLVMDVIDKCVDDKRKAFIEAKENDG